MSNDQELRRRFEALRRHEERVAPPFERDRRRSSRVARRLWPRLATAIALLLVVVVMVVQRNEKAGRKRLGVADGSFSSWRAPTDFLLSTPNAALLRSVPQIGSTAVPLTQGVFQ